MLLLACRRVVLCLAVGAAAAFATLSCVSRRSGSADPETATEAIDIIKKTTPGPARQAAIQRVLQNNFDLPYMGQTALGVNWNKATEAERDRFLKAAESAEARAYSERFGQYAGQTLTVGQVTPRPNGLFDRRQQAQPEQRPADQLQWEVRDAGQGLRITDVKVEGVSMVMTRRSDFNSYISEPRRQGRAADRPSSGSARAARRIALVTDGRKFPAGGVFNRPAGVGIRPGPRRAPWIA